MSDRIPPLTAEQTDAASTIDVYRKLIEDSRYTRDCNFTNFDFEEGVTTESILAWTKDVVTRLCDALEAVTQPRTEADVERVARAIYVERYGKRGVDSRWRLWEAEARAAIVALFPLGGESVSARRMKGIRERLEAMAKTLVHREEQMRVQSAEDFSVRRLSENLMLARIIEIEDARDAAIARAEAAERTIAEAVRERDVREDCIIDYCAKCEAPVYDEAAVNAALAPEPAAETRPTVDELQALLERDDLEVKVLPNGEVTAVPRLVEPATEFEARCEARRNISYGGDTALAFERDAPIGAGMGRVATQRCTRAPHPDEPEAHEWEK